MKREEKREEKRKEDKEREEIRERVLYFYIILMGGGKFCHEQGQKKEVFGRKGGGKGVCFVVLLRIINGLGGMFMEAGEVRVRGQGYE